MAESYYRKRIRRLMAEGFTRSQAAGKPRAGEPSVRQVREAAASQGEPVGSWLRRFLAASPAEWRAPSGVEPIAVPPEPEPPIRILPPEELRPPEERGFVTGPVFDDPLYQKGFDFGLVSSDGEILDEYTFGLLRQGWYSFTDDEGNEYTFMDLDPIDVALIRDEFFGRMDYSWRDFDDWREYISEYLGAA